VEYDSSLVAGGGPDSGPVPESEALSLPPK